MLPPDSWFITGLVVIEACQPAGVPLLGGGGEQWSVGGPTRLACWNA